MKSLMSVCSGAASSVRHRNRHWPGYSEGDVGAGNGRADVPGRRQEC